MKKIVILAIALALVVGMPLLASDFKFGGDLDWGFGLGATSTNSDLFTRADYNATFDVKATVDDLTSVTLSIKQARGTDTPGTLLEKAQIASNLGTALKLPIGVTAYAGFFNFGSEDYGDITGYDLSDIAETTGARWQAGTAINLMDVVTLEAASSFDFTRHNDYWLGAHGVFGPISAEVYWEDIGVSAASILGLGAMVDLAVMEGASLKVSAYYETQPSAATTTWAFAGGLKFDYSMFGVGFDFDGNQDNFFNRAGIELSVAPLANVGIDVGAFLTPNATDTLNNVDASVWYKAGAATWRIGYLYAPEGVAADTTWNAVAPATGSGIFMKAGLDY